MQNSTKQQLTEFIETFARQRLAKVQNISIADLRRAFPFHDLFFRDQGLLAFKAQRSIVTALGKAFYPKIAGIIALDKHKDVHLEHTIVCTLPEGMSSKIEQITTELRSATRKPNHNLEMNEVVSSRGGGLRTTPIIADLYIGDFPTGPLFVEIKTPKPNLDICESSKKKMLYFLAQTHQQDIGGAKSVFALYYNPYFPQPYGWHFTEMVMDMAAEVLIGEDFWNTIGGPGTYDELLQILAEVKRRVPLT